MANIHKAIAIEFLRFNRERFIYHKLNKDVYPQKEELIKFYGRQCQRYRNALKKLSEDDK